MNEPMQGIKHSPERMRQGMVSAETGITEGHTRGGAGGAQLLKALQAPRCHCLVKVRYDQANRLKRLQVGERRGNF